MPTTRSTTRSTDAQREAERLASLPISRKTYNLNQKLAAIKYMKQHGLRRSSRDLRIGLTTLKRWRKAEEQYSNLRNTRGIDPTKRQHLYMSRTRASFSPEHEDELIEYIENERDEK